MARGARRKRGEDTPSNDQSGAIIDESKIAIVRANVKREVQYANLAALRLLGLKDYRGKRLDDFYADAASRQTLARQLKKRSEGFIGNYQANVKRASDGVVIPVEVTGVPINDADGKFAGSLGLFLSLERQTLVNDVHAINRGADSGNNLLVAVAERTKQVIPFDVMVVTRYSKDMRHSHSFFVYGASLQSRRRWIQLNEKQAEWIKVPGVKVINDLPALLEEELWASMKEEPFVKDVLAAGCKSVLVRAVHRPQRVIGVVSLLSRTAEAFTAEHQEILQELPLDATVIHALEYTDSRRVAQRLELVRTLNGCTSIETASKKLAEQLVEMFGWSHVSVFRVDKPSRSIRLIDQHSPPKEEMRLPEAYEQGIEEGVLGRVVREEQLVILENVKDESRYVRNPAATEEMASELCCPITLEGETTVRWIVNVEDTRPSAFSTDECNELKEIASEVGSVMQRISQLYFLTQCFDHTSDPILVTDMNLVIKKTNHAAANLLGYKNRKAMKGNLADLFPGVDLRALVKKGSSSDLGELTITAKGHADLQDQPAPTIPVYVSYEAFPEGLGGYAFVARDMRHIRRAVQLQLFEQAAYQIAVEVSSPLSLALAGIERLAADDPHGSALNKVRRQLARVKRAYTKLAMFNPDARPKASNFTSIHLQTELDAIVANLPQEEAALVHVAEAKSVPAIRGDPFQISFTLETLLSLLIRCAPEREAAQVELEADGDSVELRLAGHLPGPSGDFAAAAASSSLDADLQIAEPLLKDFVANHRGQMNRRQLPGGRHQFVLRFPIASP